MFGRGGEEVLKFREYGVEPKVIPGVSAGKCNSSNMPKQNRAVVTRKIVGRKRKLNITNLIELSLRCSFCSTTAWIYSSNSSWGIKSGGHVYGLW